MVGLLVLAADGHEAQLAQELEQLIELDQLPDLGALTQLLAPPKGDLPQVVVTLPTLASYDELLEVALLARRQFQAPQRQLPSPPLRPVWE